MESSQPIHGRPTPSRQVAPGLLVASFVAGAAVMVVEVLGSRVLGPFFGVGLFVWSALLAVTLGALALGYFFGGLLSDRRSTPRLLPTLLIIAGVWVALVPLCSRTVLRLADGFGLRGGALFSGFVLFGPCLITLGMVTTVAVRLSALDAKRPGRNVGLVYCVSTLGGLIGTLLTGFVLVPAWAVPTTFSVTALSLVLTGLAGYLLRAGSRLAGLALILPALSLIPPAAWSGVRVLERSESLQGRLSVIEDTSHGTPLRLLRADHSFVGGAWVESGEPAFGFLHLLEAVWLARPEGQRLLQIGLGIGSLPMALAKRGVVSDVVEIDPEVIRLARVHFGFSTTGDIFAEDARTLIRRLDRRYDFVVHDAFTGGAVPEHLLSLEVLERLKSLLVPDGVLCLNFVGAVNGPLSASARAVHATISRAFPNVRAFRDGPEGDPQAISNIVFFAATRPIRFEQPSSYESANCESVLSAFENWEVLKTPDSGAPVITDSENPLARLSLPVSERFRSEMRALYPLEFWLD
jgi:MFS family permease